MKQLLQFVRTGETAVIDVPRPVCGPEQILVQVVNSLVSVGTERMVVDFAEKNLLEKARARPDLVRQTLDKAQREGILATYEAVQNRLEQPMALGYSCAGTVIEVGTAVKDIAVGDRVACAGGGYAVHAEVVAVPRNLVVKLPDNVDFESAAFTTLAAIALQGIRLSEVKLGEVVAVIGLGLLGQLTVQMLKAAGCVVIGTDLQAERAKLAEKLGADAAVTDVNAFTSFCRQFSDGHGVDAVLITADTKSNQPVELAGEIARKKGIVVAVGAVGMNIPRKVYYEKELDFRISSSYGPGRYDPDYEEKGHDYPYPYVRWTENRNMQAFVQMVDSGKVDVSPLITHRFAITEGASAYELITGKTGEPFLGVLLTYPDNPDLSQKIILKSNGILSEEARRVERPLTEVKLGVVGAGLFANATLLPILKKMDGIQLQGIASASGISSRSAADRFGFAYCTTEFEEMLADVQTNTLAILTRHHLHAQQVIKGLMAGKHVFVEKPLCLTPEELTEIQTAYLQAQESFPKPQLMVGFNRRFAPFIQVIKKHLATIQEPLLLHYRVNAGYIPPSHWTQNPDVGGGRLLGEGVHFIDLLIYLAGTTVTRVYTHVLPDSGKYAQDNFIIQLTFANGSLGTIIYSANGEKSFGKEMLELFGGGLSARLDDYRHLELRHNQVRISQKARLRQDKGHKAEWELWRDYLLKKGGPPMTIAEISHSMNVTFAALRSLKEKQPVTL